MPSQDFMVIDAHVHTYPSAEIGRRAVGAFGYGYWGTPPELESVMEAAGIFQAVVSSLVPVQEMRKTHLAKIPQGLSLEEERRFSVDIDAELSARLIRRNKWACEVARDHPRLNALICLDVRQTPGQMVEEITQKVTAGGAKGLKIHPVMNGHYPFDERLWPAYVKAQKIGVPVLFHAGTSELPNYNSEFAKVVHFTPVAKAFPNLTMVLAHLGRGDHAATVEIAKRHPNVFFDTAGCFIDHARPREELAKEVLALIRKIGAERILFGSDWPWHDPLSDIAVIKNLGLSLKEQEMILGGNAQRVYQIA